MRKCIQCNNNLRRGKKFCSNECWGRYRKGHCIAIGGPRKIKTLPRECLECGKTYTPHNGKQKYCSRHCMGMARRDYFIKHVVPIQYERTPEIRNKLSLAMSKRNVGKGYTNRAGGMRPDVGHYVRSSWEANFARYLIYTGQQYQYEPDTFVLRHGDLTIRYTPDFKVENKYYEVKGWWDKKSLLRKTLMSQQYPDVSIEYIAEAEYLVLEKQFKELINEWETRRAREG